MDPKDNITDGALPTEGQPKVDAPSALPTDQSSNPSSQPKIDNVVDALSLAELNKLTGKSFKDKDSALKAIGDTFSFVGKKKDDIAGELKQTGEYISKSELDTEFFYKEDTTALSNRKLIDSFAKANGITAREAAQSPEIKSILEKAKNYDASQSVKSVIETNPKLASVKNASDIIRAHVANKNVDAAAMEAAKVLREAGIV